MNIYQYLSMAYDAYSSPVSTISPFANARLWLQNHRQNRLLTLFTMVSGRANDIMMLTIAPHISWHAVDGELALFDGRDGSYHTLNQSAAAIWRGIADHQPIAQFCVDIANARNAPHELVRRDVADFIRAMLDMGLIVDTAGAPG